MRNRWVVILSCWAVWATWGLAEAQEGAWTAANERTARLCAEGKTDEAARSAEEAARLADQAFGAGHPNVAVSRKTYEAECKKPPAAESLREESRPARMEEAIPKSLEMPMRSRGLEPKRPDDKPSPILGTQGREAPRKDAQ
jgi:hypothetical protein